MHLIHHPLSVWEVLAGLSLSPSLTVLSEYQANSSFHSSLYQLHQTFIVIAVTFVYKMFITHRFNLHCLESHHLMSILQCQWLRTKSDYGCLFATGINLVLINRYTQFVSPKHNENENDFKRLVFPSCHCHRRRADQWASSRKSCTQCQTM